MGFPPGAQKERSIVMKKVIRTVLLSLLLLLAGCGKVSPGQEEQDTIRVYLWTTSLYENYAPYVQSQLPDINIQFVVGNNDLDFYTFMEENGGLPDIITCCRFSLHDAAPLCGSLMDLSITNEAGAVYNSYLNSFLNADGTVNWLPVCADAHGVVVNRGLFEKYDIPLPTDYDSFVSACKAFESLGIRGFTADFANDYTCMEVLQGLSATQLSSAAGRAWRTAYSEPENTDRMGLDTEVWPGAFERMEQFIRDTGLGAEDAQYGYTEVTELFGDEEVAMYFSSSAGVKLFREQGLDAIFLPVFGESGEGWLVTTPYFQVALNRDLEQDSGRREKAMKVLRVMMSQEAQDLIANGQDTLSYSQNVALKLTEDLKDVRACVEENRMFIRVASNEFFAASMDVIPKMLTGAYNAQEAYTAFDGSLRGMATLESPLALSLTEGYSNFTHSRGGNQAYSLMAGTLRGVYGTDVLLATGNSFTGCALAGEYTPKMAGYMVMPNGLRAYRGTLTGKELKKIAHAYVEGVEEGFVPFNLGSLPISSGLSLKVQRGEQGYTLTGITKDRKPIADGAQYTVTCLATQKHMIPLLEKGFELEDLGSVRNTWVEAVEGGNVTLEPPEDYITVRSANG